MKMSKEKKEYIKALEFVIDSLSNCTVREISEIIKMLYFDIMNDMVLKNDEDLCVLKIFCVIGYLKGMSKNDKPTPLMLTGSIVAEVEKYINMCEDNKND